MVTDMRMPEMDGFALLREVQTAYPDVIRMVLSGHTEIDVALRATSVAHQFLTKPCEAAVLVEAVTRAGNIHGYLRDAAVRSVLGRMETLPAMPQTYLAVRDALIDPEVDIDTLAGLVEQDIGISSRILKIVNSGYFGRGRTISSIRQAINLLGLRIVKNLALSVEVFEAGHKLKPVPGFNFARLQQHALLAARLASQLLTDEHEADDAFIAGLLHDIGFLILAIERPDDLAALLAQAEAEGVPVHWLEAGGASASHADLGAYLLGLWGFPYPVVEAVAYHHCPGRIAQQHFGVLGAVYVAERVIRALADPAPPRTGEEIDREYLASLGVEDRLPEWEALAARLVNNTESTP
jgi:HD-like signal output (HDOD) protein